MTDSVSHTGMTVADTEASVRFYCGTLGFTLEESRSGEWNAEWLSHLTGQPGTHLRIAMVQAADGSRVQLEQFVSPVLDPEPSSWAHPGGGHLCIEVSDIHALAAKIKEDGYTIVSTPPEPVPLPSDSVNAGGFMMGVLDPDGHVIEILQKPAGR
ncbi:MAG: VOC family protein [Propionibacteriaceae bacterium]|nr:VOC family protein [Propionibacteriaceae bacterium]